MRLKLYNLCDVQMRLLATTSTEPIISAHFALNASLCIEQLQKISIKGNINTSPCHLHFCLSILSFFPAVEKVGIGISFQNAYIFGPLNYHSK